MVIMEMDLRSASVPYVGHALCEEGRPALGWS